MSDVSTIERLLRRDRAIVTTALTAMAGLSAAYTVYGVGINMSDIDMTAMSGDMLMAAAAWTPTYAVMAFFMWWIMMIAMMLPSAAPVLLLYAALKRKRRQGSLTLYIAGWMKR